MEINPYKSVQWWSHMLVRSTRALPKVIAVCLLQLGGKSGDKSLDRAD